MNPRFLIFLADSVHYAVNGYILLIVIRSVSTFAGPLPYNRVVGWIFRLTEPPLRFLRRILPFSVVGRLDFSPLILMLALVLLDAMLGRFLIGLALQSASSEVIS